MSYFCLVRLSRSTTSKSEWPPPRITWSDYGMYIVFYWNSSRHHSSWRLDISQFCTVMLIVVLHCQNPFDNQLTSVSFEQENAAVNEEDWSSQDAQGWLAVKVHHGCTCTEVWPLQHLDRTGLNFLNHHKLGIYVRISLWTHCSMTIVVKSDGERFAQTCENKHFWLNIESILLHLNLEKVFLSCQTRVRGTTEEVSQHSVK